MILDRKTLISLAAAGSAGLLGGAFVFQFLGYAPCEMCLWQRWPHAAAILIGVIALATASRALCWLGALAAGITGALGVYHTGVERAWWQGPTSCTGSGGMDANNLLAMDGPKIVLCDQVAWELFGISMASWNAIFSFGLMVIWIMAARARR
ncbi:disulfide bond formation protein B [Thalassobius vesicularis]|uniref:Disulfide bond formation protein B n=1 Tax=Thalassobius vesicularis TaxID=1294297 RepID=A0A4S3M9K6_9RHOB|nr:disulfide bond formation protein B [Thalassobius vesicularis]THD74750.1 disulfide bond formation protein B [Thalassobius vesicularis]